MKHQKGYFSPEEAIKISLLGGIADENIHHNEKRVANAICELLEILANILNQNSSDHALVTKEWRMYSEWKVEEAFAHCMNACLNTAQYERGIDLCELLEKSGALPVSETALDHIEFNARLGKFAEAEQLAKRLFGEDDIQRYLALGDIYYFFQIQKEKMDHSRAEEYYYQAYDRGLADQQTEEGEMLFERLGGCCMDRLRILAEKELIRSLERYQIGGWQTVTQLRSNVYAAGPDAPLFQHLQSAALSRIKNHNHDEANAYLAVLSQAYSFMPQRELEGSCSFEMVECYEQEAPDHHRLQAEMFEAYQKELALGKVANVAEGALGAVAFAQFQEIFYREIDPVTGQKRSAVLKKCAKKVDKVMHDGVFLWRGFTKFRSV